MSSFETSSVAPFGAVTLYRFVQSVGVVVQGVQAWNSARITRKSLNRLTNRELDDIGLCRGDIDLIGRKARHFAPDVWPLRVAAAFCFRRAARPRPTIRPNPHARRA